MSIDDRTVDAPAESPGEARRWLRDLLHGKGVSAHSVDDACLLISELVTNAIVHGGGVARLQVDFVSDELRVEVADANPAPPAARPPGLSDGSGGLGLTIVDQLTSAWGVERQPAGKSVWATMPLTRG